VGTTPSKLKDSVRLSFVKVVEYQARGAVHLHVVLRADGIGERIVPPPQEITAELLGVAIALGSRAAFVTHPCKIGGIVHEARWGEQLDVEPIDSVSSARRAARYVAKYLSKSTENTGVLDRRIKTSGDLAALRTSGLSPHHRRLVECAWRLSRRQGLGALRRSAHCFGFSGNALSKSRRYSTSLRALRWARYEYQRRQALRRSPPGERRRGHEIAIGAWRCVGIGYGLAGDHLIAEMWAREAIEMRREGWDEITSTEAFA
jgi:hypothetical protein